MAEVVFEGDPAAQLRRLSRDLKAAGRVELRRELFKNIQVSARPLIEAAKAEASSTLPAGGGRGSVHVTKGGRRSLKTSGRVRKGDGSTTRAESVAQRVVGASFSVRPKYGRNPGVVLRGRDRKGRSIDLKALDEGRLRHPLFGNRKFWYQQSVPTGWWSRPMEKGGRAAEAAVIKAINTVADSFYG